MKRLKKYLALTRAGILDSLQFRTSMAVMLIGNIVYMIIVYHLWKAIFASAGQDVVNGMTFESTMVYLVLATSLVNFLELYIAWEVNRDVQTGKIALSLLRPFDYKSYMFWSFSGNLLITFLFTVLPTFIIVSILAKGLIVYGINIIYFFIALIFAIIISYNIDFMIATICLYTESIWGINIMKQVVVSLLSGATIPIAFFPDDLAQLVNSLPFKSIYDTPLTILLSDGSDIMQIKNKLLESAIWVVIVSLSSSLFWKISTKKLIVNGG